MVFALIITISMLFGFAGAEIWHRVAEHRRCEVRKREARIAEFMDKQLWQFISLDEWLRKENGS